MSLDWLDRGPSIAVCVAAILELEMRRIYMLLCADHSHTILFRLREHC